MGDEAVAFGRWLRELRGNATQVTLARRLDLSQGVISQAEHGHLTRDTAEVYDRYFSGRGEVGEGAILAGYRNVDEARTAEASAGVRGGGKGVVPAYRRDFFHAAAVPLVAEALDRADRTYRVLTASIPDPWTLDDLAEDSVVIASRYWSTPLDRLLPEVYARWRRLADMVDRMPVGPVGQWVVELAGQYAYYVARIGMHTGDRRLASRFGRIAARCAEISGDQLLIGSVACLRSTVAFEGDRYAEAADVAGRAVGQAHPCTRARLFSFQSRALAAGKHPDQALDALADMRAHMVNLPSMPGPGAFDEGERLGHSAMVLVEIGDDREAEALARERLAGTPANEDYRARGASWLTIGRACASHDPGAAADAGLRALEANSAWPSTQVETRARRLHWDLARKHGDVTEVARLGEAVAKLRRPAAGM